MYCIYHSRDLDGWTSGAIVKKYFEEKHKEIEGLNGNKDTEFTMIGWDYGMDLPEIPDNEHVVITDISFPFEFMVDLVDRCHVTWIDHHKSAIKEYVNRIMEISPIFIAVFPQFELGENDDIDVSKVAACELTWRHFFPECETPRAVKFLGAYDTFRHIGTSEEYDVKMFQYGARAVFHNPDQCNAVLDNRFDVEEVRKIGEGIYSYLLNEAERHWAARKDVLINGHKFAAMNAPLFNPKNFGLPQDGYDGFMAYSYRGDQWVVSLYSDTIDCSVIAKRRGGGGHKGAAGFQTDDIYQFLN